jgi:hypothetical protein
MNALRLILLLALAATPVASFSLHAQQPKKARPVNRRPVPVPRPPAPVTRPPVPVTRSTAVDTTPVNLPRLLLVPTRDTVLIFFTGAVGGVPRVELVRDVPGAAAVPVPVPAAVQDGAALERAIGADWTAVRELARVADGDDLRGVLARDPVAATLLSSLFRSVGRAAGRLAVDVGVPVGRDIAYRAQFFDLRGKPIGAPVITRVRVADLPPGAPPTPRVRAVGTGAQLVFTAPASSGVDDRVIAYLLERRDDEGPWQRVGAPMPRQYGREMTVDESELAIGYRVAWRIRSLDLAGRTSVPSAEASLLVRDLLGPSPTRETIARAEGTQVLVTWAAVADEDVAGYHIERAASLNGPWTRLTTTPLAATTPQFADTNAPARRQMFWRVRAVDRSGNLGAPGAGAPATRSDLAPPAPVVGLAARVEKGAVVLAWTLPKDRDVVGVHIWRGEDTARMSRRTDRPLRAVTYREPIGGSGGLVPGHRYLYRVAALDSSRNASLPMEVTITVPDAVRPPAADAVAARDIGGRYVDVTWLPSAAADVRQYTVTRRVVGSSTAATLVATQPGGPGPFAVRDSTVQVGRRYEYFVTAADSAGNSSAPSRALVEVRTAAPPPAPRFLAADARRGGGVALRWERVVDEALAGYAVYRGKTPTGPFTKIASVPATTLVATDASGSASDWYVVRAVDAAGRESQSSPPARGAPR